MNVSFEWSPQTFGILFIPLLVLGVVIFSFPDLIYTFIRYYSYRTLKPNSAFEDNFRGKDIPGIVEVFIKTIGVLVLALGLFLFGFSDKFYEFWFE